MITDAELLMKEARALAAIPVWWGDNAINAFVASKDDARELVDEVRRLRAVGDQLLACAKNGWVLINNQSPASAPLLRAIHNYEKATQP